VLFGLIISLTGFSAQERSALGGLRWWKGNLHTHSLWSDGDDYPEMIAEWYKQHGYHFLAFSDHNILLQDERWMVITGQRAEQTFQKYLQRFGPRWVEQVTLQSTQVVRLKPLSEFRSLFEAPDRFLMIPSEEISDQYKKIPIHINATNLRDLIPPQGGTNVLDVMQRNVNAVLAQRQKTGQPLLPHLNHPNFGWAITAEDLMQLRGENFFEVYNGHPSIHNDGDVHHASTERMWDIILTFRLTSLKLGPMYALAVDDSHHYHALSRTNSNSGRGWIMVRAPRLEAAAIITAMEAGDFYACTGVRLKEVTRGPTQLSLVIDPEPGVTYITKFFGTRKGYDPASEPVEGPTNSVAAVTRHYSSEIGTLLGAGNGTLASYVLQGDEIYVRAKVISSKPKANSVVPDETEMAWTQPLVPPVPATK